MRRTNSKSSGGGYNQTRKNVTSKKQKDSKGALASSIVALVLCCAMLVGTTFAWFTDSVTSGKNKIVAGNLDVELEYKDVNGEWKPVEGDTNLFKSIEGDDAALWEPGHTEYVQLRIRNAGSLALKYQFSVNVYGDEDGGEEKQYTNVNNEKFKLSDYLVFNQIDGEAAENPERSDFWLDAALENDALGKLDEIGVSGELVPKGKESETGISEKVITLAVYMPTSVGNAANQMTSAKATDGGAPTIYLGLTLNATQTPYEYDSFDEQYDKNAWTDLEKAKRAETLQKEGYTVAADATSLISALETAEKIVLADDIDLESNRLEITSDLILDLNGNTLSAATTRTLYIKDGSTVTIRGDENSIVTSTARNPGSNAAAAEAPLYISQGTVILEGGRIVGGTTEKNDSAVVVSGTGGFAKLEIRKGVIDNGAAPYAIRLMKINNKRTSGGVISGIDWQQVNVIGKISGAGAAIVGIDETHKELLETGTLVSGELNGNTWYFPDEDSKNVTLELFE